MAKIGILGAGAWGLSVAIKAANNGHGITLWGHSETSVSGINNTHQSPRLTGVSLPSELSATQDLTELVAGIDLLVIAVASSYLEGLIEQLPALPQGIPLVILSKGLLERDASFLISDFFKQKFPSHPYAVLSGPNIALEIAQGKPAASVLACEDNKTAEWLQSIFSGPDFRLYRSTDVRGVECGGIFKNVIAIAAGICDGLDCGDNAKAALMTRGLSEIQRVAVFFGGRLETVGGLSGLGDMMTTCLSPHSRNRSFGEACVQTDISNRETFMFENTVEGQRTISLLATRYPELLKDCPIMTAVYDVLYRQLDPQDAIRQLMDRELISESDEL